jgi:hypothetical protein
MLPCNRAVSGTLAIERMTLRAYINNIHAKTGKSPKDFVRLAREKGLLRPHVKPEEIVAWLREEFGLGHGHSLAIYSLLKPKMGKQPPRKNTRTK